jgi:hypothetical protein
MLPCGHTFCKRCLQQEVQQERLRCPLDQKQFGAIGSLPTNYMLLQVNAGHKPKVGNVLQHDLQHGRATPVDHSMST